MSIMKIYRVYWREDGRKLYEDFGDRYSAEDFLANLLSRWSRPLAYIVEIER